MTKCSNCGHAGGFSSSFLQNEWLAACPAVSKLSLTFFATVNQVLQCGLTLRETDLKMQDELATLFNRSMNFAIPQAKSEPQQQDRPPPTPSANFSISQHYHHSAHRVPMLQQPDDTISGELTQSVIARLLSQQGIDSTSLSLSQITLFKNANTEQRERLVQLWKISPIQPSGSLENTTIEKEEELDRLRYERTSAAADLGDMEMAYEKSEDVKAAEPYIESGYELLAKRDYNLQAQPQLQPHLSAKAFYQPLGSAVGLPHALDPAFSAKEWWRDFAGNQPMEFQYGMFQHMYHYQPQQVARRQEDEEML